MTKRLITHIAAGALALGLVACGPTQRDVANSIQEMYEENGGEDVSVNLEATDDGGYTGSVSFTDPGNGQTTTHNCTVDAAEGNEAQWQCNP